MSAVPVWQEAVALPWLRPSTAALLALADDPPDGRTLLRDPAAVAHILRYARPTPGPDDSLLSPTLLSQPGLAANAAVLLAECSQAAPEWESADSLTPVNQVVATASTAAAELAFDRGGCRPEVASAVARLTGLGWYALHTVQPDAVSDCLDHGARTGWRRGRQEIDIGVITRRLAGRWRLPDWVTATVGNLHLRAEDAVRLGSPAGLFAIVQAATWAAERRQELIGLTDQRMKPSAHSLFADAERIVAALPNQNVAPHAEPAPKGLLVRLLHATAVARRAGGATWLAEAEDRVDALGNALAELRAGFETAVRDAKLAGLAEFAAGASHEINNPLAVISGHAQLLLHRETDPDRRNQLGVIVRQTKRVADLLQGSLQFARPSRPVVAAVNVSDLVAATTAALRGEVDAKRLSLVVRAGAGDDLLVRADAGQLGQALQQVVRNAVESAPDRGWVGITIETDGDRVDFVVEDSGPGPTAREVDHLFDPFFSGRTAGRGRGLGLSIAWRFATINGGDVRYEPTADGPTRFVLSFPVIAGAPALHRKCA